MAKPTVDGMIARLRDSILNFGPESLVAEAADCLVALRRRVNEERERTEAAIAVARARDEGRWAAQNTAHRREQPSLARCPYSSTDDRQRGPYVAWCQAFTEEWHRTWVYETAMRGEMLRAASEPLRIKVTGDGAALLLRATTAERERDELRAAVLAHLEAIDWRNREVCELSPTAAVLASLLPPEPIDAG
jgi:hypothetical protein